MLSTAGLEERKRKNTPSISKPVSATADKLNSLHQLALSFSNLTLISLESIDELHLASVPCVRCGMFLVYV